MDKKIFLFSFMVLCFNALNAQTAEQMIDNFINEVKTTAVRTDFSMEIREKNAKSGNVIQGSFTMKNNKFIMEMNEMTVYFNGKTQWAYSPESEEVTITEPTHQELAETNPMAVLYSYRTTAKIDFAANASNSTNYIIEMLPKSKLSELSKVVIEFSRKTGNLLSIKHIEKSGITMTLTLTNFRKKIQITDKEFTFDTKKHKNIIINDLR